MSNVCPRCRTYNSDSSRFCSKCGSPLPAHRSSAAQGAGHYAQHSSGSFSALFNTRHPYGAQGLAITSLVLGIVSIVFCWAYIFNIFTMIMGGVGIACSVIARMKILRTRQPGNGIAIAGLVCSIVGAALSLILIFAITVPVCESRRYIRYYF